MHADWLIHDCSSASNNICGFYLQSRSANSQYLESYIHDNHCIYSGIHSGMHRGVVVCTDLLGKETYRQIGVGRMVTSGGLHGVMVSTLARNTRDVGSIPALGTTFPIFITPPPTVVCIMVCI